MYGESLSHDCGAMDAGSYQGSGSKDKSGLSVCVEEQHPISKYKKID
jgi:hypothetical protein